MITITIYDLKVDSDTDTEAETRVVTILETVLIINLWIKSDMTSQEEAVTHMSLRTEVAETDTEVRRFVLDMGILCKSTQIDTTALKIVAGTSTDLRREDIEVLLTVELHNTQRHQVVHKQITDLAINTEGEIRAFAIGKLPLIPRAKSVLLL